MVLAEAINAATRAGFKVAVDEDFDGWVIYVPARPRVPAHTQGAFKDETRAWMAAASLALEDEQT